MKKRFGPTRLTNFPVRLLKADFEEDIMKPYEHLKTEFGFIEQEMEFIMRNKPSVVLY